MAGLECWRDKTGVGASGRELFYLDNDNFLIAVSIQPSGSALSPVRVLQRPYYSGFKDLRRRFKTF